MVQLRMYPSLRRYLRQTTTCRLLAPHHVQLAVSCTNTYTTASPPFALLSTVLYTVYDPATALPKGGGQIGKGGDLNPITSCR